MNRPKSTNHHLDPWRGPSWTCGASGLKRVNWAYRTFSRPPPALVGTWGHVLCRREHQQTICMFYKTIGCIHSIGILEYFWLFLLYCLAMLDCTILFGLFYLLPKKQLASSFGNCELWLVTAPTLLILIVVTTQVVNESESSTPNMNRRGSTIECFRTTLPLVHVQQFIQTFGNATFSSKFC